MPKRERKKDKKKKKKLTNKEILKLLKALKPKTQQIVRVNVGDREKKKKGEVQSSYNPPFVFPSQGFPSIINLGQAPPPFAPPPPLNPVANPVEAENIIKESLKPRKEKKNKSKNLFSETEDEQIIKRPLRQKTLDEFSEYNIFSRFNKPKIINPSDLSYKSSFNSRMTDLPSSNDPFLPVSIQTNQGSDQMGNVATPFTSEEWSLSPDGNVMSVEEMQQQNITKPPPPPPVEETFEETFNVDEETLPPPPPPVKPKKKLIIDEDEETIVLPSTEEMAKEKAIKTKFLKPKKSQIISDLNIAISKGEINASELPAEFFNKKGGAVGKLKETITLSALQPYWEELYVKRGGFGL